MVLWSMVGLDDPRDLFQSQQHYDSVNPSTKLPQTALLLPYLISVTVEDFGHTAWNKSIFSISRSMRWEFLIHLLYYAIAVLLNQCGLLWPMSVPAVWCQVPVGTPWWSLCFCLLQAERTVRHCWAKVPECYRSHLIKQWFLYSCLLLICLYLLRL